MINKENFALNRIISPNLSFNHFIKLVKKTKLQNIEIRNDLLTNKIENENLRYIKEITSKNKIEIISINALQKFNIWNKDREKELLFLCKYAKKIGCKGIVLVPLNTGEYTEYRLRNKILIIALKQIEIIINDFGLIGYIEPLGFKTSSLRLKSEIAKVINSLPKKSNLMILHDTFHHYLSQEKEIYSELTGLVHISGVDKKIKKKEMKDDDRVLINENDIIGNLEQIDKLISEGYKKIFSLEPFSKKIQNISNPSSEIIESVDYLLKNI